MAATLVRLARIYGGIADMLLEEVRIVSIVIDIFCVQCVDHSKTFFHVFITSTNDVSEIYLKME